jgi:type I restriction enzyme R subunit
MSTVAEELGMLSTSPEQVEAEQEVAALGPEQSERAGTPLFFRKPEQRPIAMRSAHATLQSQQVLAAGMLRPAHLLDLVRNFTVFQQVDGKTRKVVARYQQFRSIHKAVGPLAGRSHARPGCRSRRARRHHLAHAGLRQEPQYGLPRAQDAHDAAA